MTIPVQLQHPYIPTVPLPLLTPPPHALDCPPRLPSLSRHPSCRSFLPFRCFRTRPRHDTRPSRSHRPTDRPFYPVERDQEGSAEQVLLVVRVGVYFVWVEHAGVIDLVRVALNLRALNEWLADAVD